MTNEINVPIPVINLWLCMGISEEIIEAIATQNNGHSDSFCVALDEKQNIIS